jgi:hypothetical protein
MPDLFDHLFIVDINISLAALNLEIELQKIS